MSEGMLAVLKEHTLWLCEVTLLDSGLQGLVEQRVELGL